MSKDGKYPTGVHRAWNKSRGCRYENFIATWTDRHGQLRKKYFSISKLGEDEALKQAIECRETMHEQESAARIRRKVG
jgi:hypothetical protein